MDSYCGNTGQKRADLRTLNKKMKREKYRWAALRRKDGRTRLAGRVDLVHLVSLVQPNKPIKQEKQAESRGSRVTQPIGVELVIEVGSADLEKFGGLRTIAPGLLERLKDPRTFRLADGPARNGAEIVPCRFRSHRHDVLATELWTGGGDDRPLKIMLQLSHITRP